MTGGPRTCYRRFNSIQARAPRRMVSSRGSTTSGKAPSRTSSTSCVRCSGPADRARVEKPSARVLLFLQRLPDQPGELADHAAAEGEHADHEDHTLHHG